MQYLTLKGLSAHTIMAKRVLHFFKHCLLGGYVLDTPKCKSIGTLNVIAIHLPYIGGLENRFLKLLTMYATRKYESSRA